ncbi:uncharacterized protein BO80DRAFT_61637 [Aspergillus ibericus CBS 121593]|uniref:Uncharacterized protein n=1 Tax=Aspergillus ibericus CBS 121593 TaxID=1448316 RepID=A0A395H0Z3_9EURO|nr:hypothetical protein BO80DRAFT_61637 [Aspergillus ibericus CBS 121593]RAL01521.1 hypothetical protein BO80DRAFT_61637 [Aspergillus ibericus CBS 121593]
MTYALAECLHTSHKLQAAPFHSIRLIQGDSNRSYVKGFVVRDQSRGRFRVKTVCDGVIEAIPMDQRIPLCSEISMHPMRRAYGPRYVTHTRLFTTSQGGDHDGYRQGRSPVLKYCTYIVGRYWRCINPAERKVGGTLGGFNNSSHFLSNGGWKGADGSRPEFETPCFSATESHSRNLFRPNMTHPPLGCVVPILPGVVPSQFRED